MTMARPRGGDWLEDEAKSLELASVDIVISALTLSEIEELDLNNEEKEFSKKGIAYFNFPIPDREFPQDKGSLKTFLNKILEEL